LNTIIRSNQYFITILLKFSKVSDWVGIINLSLFSNHLDINLRLTDNYIPQNQYFITILLKFSKVSDWVGIINLSLFSNHLDINLRLTDNYIPQVLSHIFFIIRRICKSKYIAVLPDRNNPFRYVSYKFTYKLSIVMGNELM